MEQLNEIKRMQQLAGIISESENIDELFGFGGGNKDTKGSVNVIALGWNFNKGAEAYLSDNGKIVCYPDTPEGAEYAKAWLKAIEYGNILHEILSFIKTKDDIDLALTKAIENGLIVSSQKEDVLKTIYEIVNHQDLSLFFSNEHKILNEKTIIQKEGNLVIPDRMVLTKLNEIYLLDYKTGTHQTKYQLQLENYQNAIEKMGFKVTKKALVDIGDTLEIVNLH